MAVGGQRHALAALPPAKERQMPIEEESNAENVRWLHVALQSLADILEDLFQFSV